MVQLYIIVYQDLIYYSIGMSLASCGVLAEEVATNFPFNAVLPSTLMQI